MPTHDVKVQAIQQFLEQLRTASPQKIKEAAEILADTQHGSPYWVKIKRLQELLPEPAGAFRIFVLKIGREQLEKQDWDMNAEENLEMALEGHGLSSASIDEVTNG